MYACGGYFLNKGKLYCQIDGVTMESPLRPTLAFFLAQLKNRFMNTNFDFLPAYYCSYVDDLICVFDCLENPNRFFNFIKNLRPNLKFTHEIRPKQLTFLDREIYFPSHFECVDTSKIFRKRTNTYVFLIVILFVFGFGKFV